MEFGVEAPYIFGAYGFGVLTLLAMLGLSLRFRWAARRRLAREQVLAEDQEDAA